MTGRMMRKILVLTVIMAALSGCNTVAGVGEDVSGGARKVQGWLG
jgi:predicted small secreted protein